MELLAISSIFDEKAGQKRPALSGYGQIYPSRCQENLPCGRKASLSFLDLNKFDPYLNNLLN